MERTVDRRSSTFADRYGPWALVAGASQGLGAAFARELAKRGLSVVLVARHLEGLEVLRAELERDFHVAARAVALDLSSPDLLAVIRRETDDIEVGLFIHNAAFSNGGPFLDRDLESLTRTIDTGCRAPLFLAHHFAGRMRKRGRGGLLLMSSLTAFNGSPGLVTYGATKAFNLILGEGLWYELAAAGIDVTVCCAGAVRTPGYLASVTTPTRFPPVLEPERVAREALAALGRRAIVIPGRFNRFASFLMRRLLSRRATVGMMGASVKNLNLT